jgi:AP-1 complex subunit gamma-1
MALKADISQESLTLAATWIIGEYSEVLLEGGIVDEDQPKSVRPPSTSVGQPSSTNAFPLQASDKDLVDLLISIVDSPYANYLTKQFVLASVTKISSRRTTSQAEQDRIAELLAKYTTSPELELQQRAVEFASLFALGELREGVLERMPPPELKATVMGVGKFAVCVELQSIITSIVSENKPVGSTQSKDVCSFSKRLLHSAYLAFLSQADLLGDEVVSTPINGQPTVAQNNEDLLRDIFGSSTTPSAPGVSSPPLQTPRTTVDDILGLFDVTSTTNPTTLHVPPASAPPGSAFSLPQSQTQPQPPAPTPAPAPPSAALVAPRLTAYTAYNKNELKITLTPQTSTARPGIVMILARFQVTGTSPVTGLSFQAAVPKVKFNIRLFAFRHSICWLVTTATDATYVKSKH